MGDLDDFFAKKDKKKGKTKMVAANLLDDMKKENDAKKEKQKKKQQLEHIEQAPHVLKKTKEDDDWEDFEDPSGLNLEGLRVLNLAERQAQEAGRGADGEGGSGQDGEGGASVDEGPWRRKAAESAAAAAAEPAEAGGEAAAPSAAGGTGASATVPAAGSAADPQASSGGSGEDQPAPRAKYIPPQLRSAAAAVSGRPQAADLFAARPLPRGSGRRDKNAPNINDVEEFPTLAPGCSGADDEGAFVPAGRRPGQAEDSRPFESVRDQSGRRSHPAHSQLPSSGSGGSAKADAVSVQNRWDALGEDAAS